MVAPIPTLNNRRIYGRPGRDGRLAQPGRVSACIQVALGSETIGSVPETKGVVSAERAGARTHLPGPGRVCGFHCAAPSVRLVLNEALKRSSCPPMHVPRCALARLRAVAGVQPVFCRGRDDIRFDRCFGDGVARFAIGGLCASRSFAEDLVEPLFRAVATAEREIARQDQATAAGVAQAALTEELVRPRGGEGIVWHLRGRRKVRWRYCGFPAEGFDDANKKLLPFAQHRFRVGRLAGCENGTWIRVQAQRAADDVSIEGGERDGLGHASVGSQWGPNPVPEAIGAPKRKEATAGIGMDRSPRGPRGGLLSVHFESDQGPVHRQSSPLGGMLSTFDRAAGGAGTGMARPANGVPRRPQVSNPPAVLQRRVWREQPPHRDVPEPPKGEGGGARPLGGTMYAMQRDLLRRGPPFPFCGHRVSHAPYFLGYRPCPSVVLLLRTPDRRVGRGVAAPPVGDGRPYAL